MADEPAEEQGGGSEEAATTEGNSLLAPPERSIREQAAADGADVREEEAEEGARPEWLEEKFWDAEKQAPRVDSLAKAFKDTQAELRRLQNGKGKQEEATPAVPDAYDLKLPDGVEGLTETEVANFKKAGFTNDQAQAVLDMIVESVGPVVTGALVKAENQKLAAQWGMEAGTEVFTERMQELSSWAHANYPESMVQYMARSAEGVNQLWSMMQAGATGPGAAAERRTTSDTDELVSMMSDERYFNGDPAYVAEVERRAGIRK